MKRPGLGLGVLLILGAATSAPAQTVPAGFTREALLSGLDQPVGMTILADGRILITEQRSARVKVFAGGKVGTLGTVPNVNASGNERGLLGIDVDPKWPGRPFLYCYYNYTSPNNLRLSMFTVTGDLTDPASTNLKLGSRYDILTDIPDVRSNHNGGTCRFGTDGQLYVSIGDDASSCAAQSITDLRGVILRLEVAKLPGQGSGPPPKADITPAGNPFSGPNQNARLTWAYGLRNPFRFHVDPVTGRLYIADVGLRGEEELDEAGTGGANFGWPWYQGFARYSSCSGPLPATVNPIASYDRSAYRSASIISFTRYRNRLGGPHNFGNNYEGDVFFAEYYVGFLRRLKATGSSWAPAPPVPGQPSATDWATGIQNIGDARVGPDGAIYYLRVFPGTLERLRYTPQLPTLTVAGTARAGRPFLVRSTRNPGDFFLLAIGTTRIPPTPLPGFFGFLEMVPIPLAAGVAGPGGRFDVTLPVPPAAVGLTVHFQCVALVQNENYLSALRSVLVVP